MEDNNIYGDLEKQTEVVAPVTFATAVEEEVDDELAMLQQQVSDIQQDHALRQLHDAATKEEGQRKKVPAPTAAAAPTNASIFIGNLDPRTSEADLRLFFQPCGPIERVTVLKDKLTGQPKGTAYVTFEAEEGATAALLKDGQQCHGKPLKIAIKRDNIPASMRGGRGAAPGGFVPRGRGGPPMPNMQGMNPNPNNMMNNPLVQMMGAMMMAMGQQGGAFNPYGQQPRGRGGRGGRGGGRGGF